MSKYTFILVLAFLLGTNACTEVNEPVSPGVIEKLITDDPVSFLEHWHGDSGILARFGKNSEIGALLQYEFKDRRQFVIFDGTGKRFISDKNGTLSGPHNVKDLFDITNIWLTAGDDTAKKYAELVEKEGVESAYFGSLPLEPAYSFTITTKQGNLYNLYKRNGNNFWEILNSDYGIGSHSSVQGGMEALFAKEPSTKQNEFYKHAYLIDNTGKNIENGDDGGLGLVTKFWPELPSTYVEAACYLKDQNLTPTTILILGAHDKISHGQFVCVITETSPDVFVYNLSDLRKEY